MTAETSSATALIEQCLRLLEDVVRLSHSVASAVEADEFEEIEHLFKSRGEKIKKLAETEAEIERRLDDLDPQSVHIELTEYKQKRDRLFTDIQEIDKRVNDTITESRDAVLSEMKELYRGKKMNEGYLNPSIPASGFIDIKE